MDNKLSELSKPVGRFAFEPLEERWHHIKHGEKQNLDGGPWDLKKLYSQEYVSALLVSLGVLGGAIDMANESTRIWKERADGAEKRIAELEERLATPVRLPELCGDGENDNEYTEGLNDGINQSAKAIRAAGFIVGDE